MAVAAGVNIVPGYDKPLDSLEQALKLVHETDLTYPVLLKAAAGGGGKGMRTCYNDRDLKEAWGLSKAEALKFFSDGRYLQSSSPTCANDGSRDEQTRSHVSSPFISFFPFTFTPDRLLIEKYIEEPHHIEFQVISYTDKNDETQVLVFPERECSIQRRNQKVIEETPSVLMTPETRQKMAKQVEALCKACKYESAGTVEFLVDKNLNFYFLEMNTRLQVEHPITEAVTGVDLVKCMLWVGAGWGLPPEVEEARQGQLIMPFKGHAIETRVYAEDPLRGYLPSIGPLSPYVEPSLENNTKDAYVRIDSGVAPGHIVTPHYDPMLSKLVYYGQDRLTAIKGLCNAIDEYVIEGVQHNSRLVQSVLRHPAFIQGETPTSFLPTHFPDGFSGVKLTPEESHEFAAAASAIVATRQEMLDEAALHDEDGTVYVRFGGLFGGKNYRVEWPDEKTAKVFDLSDETLPPQTISLDAPVVVDPVRYSAKITLNGTSRTIQVLGEKKTGELKLQMYGCDESVLVLSKREHELSVHMHEPIIPDTSNLIQSPMPGTLISFAVSEGDEVEIGQEICIVEAMKMQNIIRAPMKAKIAKVNVGVGASLVSDQTICEFFKE